MLPREDLNLDCRDQNPMSCLLDDAGRFGTYPTGRSGAGEAARPGACGWAHDRSRGSPLCEGLPAIGRVHAQRDRGLAAVAFARMWNDRERCPIMRQCLPRPT